MASVTFDDRSFMIDGSRLWLAAGSLHYFRVPAALWRDRLLKLRRAGLNTVTTYVAWNLHEPQEGQFVFEGDLDVAEFIRQAGDLGLYVILRPGPYICAEWDFGGLPAWLTTKSGMAYRTSSAAFMHYFDKYFQKLLPRLAPLQVSRGGNIILIQNENEYPETVMPDRLTYLEFISQLIRRSGFDIPIITCNRLTEPLLPGAVECVNGWSNCVDQLKQLRLRQLDAPLLVTEFWDGWFDAWGDKHHTRDGLETARRAMEILGCGAQFNYYMFHGGTNFGFYGSRLVDGAARWQTTSYDYDAPIAEGGGLTDKYYQLRPVNLLASTMGPQLAQAINDSPGATLHDACNVLNTAGLDGSWAVITTNGANGTEQVTLSLPTGRRLQVPLGPCGAAAIPYELILSPAHTLDWVNVTPLGLFEGKVLVLHGPAGWEAQFSINGKPYAQTIPGKPEPAMIEADGLLVAVVNTELAQRTWLVDDSLIFGGDFVGETIDDVVPSADMKQLHVIDLTEQPKKKTRSLTPSKASRPAPPRLRKWQKAAVCTEPDDESLQWTRLDRPRDVDALGIHYGYSWYRMIIPSPRPRKRQLFVPDCADRALLFLNGRHVGTWGHGPGAKRAPIGVSLKKGDNVLTALVDNLGRYAYGPRLGEKKGLYGHIWDAKPLRVRKFRLKKADGLPRRVVPRHLQHLADRLPALPAWEATTDLSLTKVSPVHMQFENLPCHVGIVCNDQNVAFFQMHRTNWGDVTLAGRLKKGKNQIRLLLWGDVTEKDLARIEFHALLEPLTADEPWGLRPWGVPAAPGGETSAARRPCWWSSSFAGKDAQLPLMVSLEGATKGQAWLNGHNLGRFWSVGPQQWLYLPSCWLQDENELLVFSEDGAEPSSAKLAWRPLGPYGP